MTDNAYDRLHPSIRRWVREQGWEELREIQNRATETILDGAGDLLISASTASGKTEAAFLPILTAIADRRKPGIAVLYVSPLKALINDQFGRLDDLCGRFDLPITRWHGDASRSAKNRMRQDPRGIVLITPESIEAMLIRRPEQARRMLSDLDFIVIDETHAFMEGPRGLHMGSLLKRIDAISTKPARRVGLSATIGDTGQAARWLRPNDPARVVILQDPGGGLDLKLQIRGYLESDVAPLGPDGNRHAAGTAIESIAEHLFATLRGSNNLVFAGSRAMVEEIADLLRVESEKTRVANEFMPHHGNLSTDLREALEVRLKRGDQPTTAICTTTLELGIDIGSVKSIAQIGAPRSISSLRQRLGRTGRRKGAPSILRIYVTESNQNRRDVSLANLGTNIVRAIAAVNLLSERFIEPATSNDMTATALLHQTLSIIAEREGERASVVFRTLGGPGPFELITKADFITLLRDAAARNLIEQAEDGGLMLGRVGEFLTKSRDFYSLFQSDEEWKLKVGARSLGTIPLSNAIMVGMMIVFAGQRWEIADIDENSHTLVVTPAAGGAVMQYDRNSAEEIHDRLIQEMRNVYETDEIPGYLDPTARILLENARSRYRELGLDRASLIETERRHRPNRGRPTHPARDGYAGVEELEHDHDDEPAEITGCETHLFPWMGTTATAVFMAALATQRMKPERNDLGITLVGADAERARSALTRIARMTADDLERVGDTLSVMFNAKLDNYISKDLLKSLWKRRNASIIAKIPSMARDLLARDTQFTNS